MRRSPALVIVTLVGCAGASSCSAQAKNPVLGEWRLVKPDCQVVTRLVYTSTEYAAFEIPTAVYPGWRRIPVTYNVSKGEVWVLPKGYGSNQTRVFVIDANHIRPDDATGCVYERVR